MKSKLSRLAACCLLAACGSKPEPSPEAAPTPAPAAAPAPAPAVAAIPADSPAEALLFDFRTRVISRGSNPPAPTISPAEASAVNAAIGGKVKLDKAQCGPGEDDTFQRILDRREGAFTAPNAAETLYVFVAEFCDPATREARDTLHAVIFASGVAVAAFSSATMGDQKSDAFVGETILATLDVDQDGIQELLTSTAGDGQGIFVERARLYSFKDRKLALLRDFNETLTDVCASDMDERTIEAHILTASLDVRRFTANCVASGKYLLSDFKPAP